MLPTVARLVKFDKCVFKKCNELLTYINVHEIAIGYFLAASSSDGERLSDNNDPYYGYHNV